MIVKIYSLLNNFFSSSMKFQTTFGALLHPFFIFGGAEVRQKSNKSSKVHRTGEIESVGKHF